LQHTINATKPGSTVEIELSNGFVMGGQILVNNGKTVILTVGSANVILDVNHTGRAFELVDAATLDLRGPMTLTNGNLGNGNPPLYPGVGGLVSVFYGCSFFADHIVFANSTVNTQGGAISGPPPIFPTSPIATAVRIYNSVFQNNIAYGYGGALHANPGWNVTISSCFFYFNQAARSGGAICAYAVAAMSISTSTFESNQATSAGAVSVLQRSRNVVVHSTNFSNSKCNGGAGSIELIDLDDPAVFEKCKFEANHGKTGGAIFVGYAHAAFHECGFISNTVLDTDSSRSSLGERTGGAGIYARNALFVNVSDCRFISNGQLGIDGSAVLLDGTNSMIMGSLFLRNIGNSTILTTQSSDIGDSIFIGEDPSVSPSTAVKQVSGFLRLDGVSFTNNKRAVDVSTGAGARAIATVMNSNFKASSIFNSKGDDAASNTIYVLDSSFDADSAVVPALTAIVQCNDGLSPGCGPGARCTYNNKTKEGDGLSVHCSCPGSSAPDYSAGLVTAAGTITLSSCMCPRNYGGELCSRCYFYQTSNGGIASNSDCYTYWPYLLCIAVLSISLVCFLFRDYLELCYDMLWLFGLPTLSFSSWCAWYGWVGGCWYECCYSKAIAIGLRSSEQGLPMMPYVEMVDMRSDRKCSRFTAVEMKTGMPEESAFGIGNFIGVDDDLLAQFMKDKEKAVEREWIGNERARKLFAYLDWDKDPVQRKTKSGDAQRNAEDVYNYIARERAFIRLDKGNDGVDKERDAKNVGRSLDDFVNLPEAQAAKLKPVHVLALRLYTSTSFSLITMPLRKKLNGQGEDLWDVGLVLPNGWKDTCGDNEWNLDTRYQHDDGSDGPKFKQREHPGKVKEVTDGKTRHPFAATVYFLAEALKQLRAVGLCKERTTKASLFSWFSSTPASVTLWRGAANMKPPSGFLENGGSELAAMSTSIDPNVAKTYAFAAKNGGHANALIIKVRTRSFMDRGVDIGFLSLYASEQEYLYPPLTYLRPRAAVTRGGKTVVLVEAVFPS
jgi:hypothetical protein